MMNRKRNLIEALHGSVRELNNLAELVDEITVYDDTNHVDNEFLLEALKCISLLIDASNMVVNRISVMLVPDFSEDNSRKKADEGKKWNTEEILKHCILENNVLKLPEVQFNRKSYVEAKKWIEEAGGSWEGGKTQGFVFPFNPERIFAILKEGKRYNLQQEYQFFETPSELADWLVMLVGSITQNDTVLEPSAGRGAIVRAIHRACSGVTVDCYELMPENRKILSNEPGINILGEDFIKECRGKYSKIIANPPFTKNQDIDHVMLMYKRLDENGTLAAITSTHWTFSNEKKCVDFRNWLNKAGGQTFKIDSGEFKKSGTAIRTLAIVIKR